MCACRPFCSDSPSQDSGPQLTQCNGCLLPQRHRIFRHNGAEVHADNNETDMCSKVQRPLCCHILWPQDILGCLGPRVLCGLSVPLPQCCAVHRSSTVRPCVSRSVRPSVRPSVQNRPEQPHTSFHRKTNSAEGCFSPTMDFFVRSLCCFGSGSQFSIHCVFVYVCFFFGRGGLAGSCALCSPWTARCH